jgi:bacterioferritin-associated ferredoxin
MYVCVCRAVSDRQIREVVSRGAASLEEVKAYLPVAGCCGCCEEAANELISSYKKTTPAEQAVA